MAGFNYLFHQVSKPKGDRYNQMALFILNHLIPFQEREHGFIKTGQIEDFCKSFTVRKVGDITNIPVYRYFITPLFSPILETTIY